MGDAHRSRLDSYLFAMNRLNEATMVLGVVRRPWHRSGHLQEERPAKPKPTEEKGR